MIGISEGLKMRINRARKRGVHVQASLFRNSEMAVQERAQQLQQHDKKQQHSPKRDAWGCT
ncbi:hypothetical protein LMG18101_05128 [Ralstonia flaminis]|uniref:Uncharacterized protein n=1 Tax=Ralstonia flaminis TaxID=3058597 RepID=A0ABM9KDQ7_9RALS|nr:hypothetical protein LMG18101_05128 [Ralstonia sp. LMG 18101]